MALILGIIPKQGFEKCRDAIGVIILTELTNQKTLQGSDFPEDINILTESLTPFDASDQMAINIQLANASYSQMTQADAQGKTMYVLDFYASGVNSGDSAFRLHKFIGMVGYIFRSAQYRILGLPVGLIGGTYVESFVIGQTKKEDSGYTSMGQISLAVRIQEQAQAWTGVDLVGNDSAVKLALTEKGYKFVFNNS